MPYNPEKRVWRGKSYKRGGVTGRHAGTTIAEERERDLVRSERDLERADRDAQVARGD